MSSAARWQVGVWAVIWAITAAPVFGSDVPKADRVGGRVLQPDVLGGYASTHLVVKFKPGVFQRGPSIGPVARGIKDSRREPLLSRALQATCAQWGATRIRPFYHYEFGNPELAAELGLDRTYIIEVPKGTNVPAMAAAVRRFDAEVQTASYDGIGGIAAVPNDPEFYRQWNMHNEGEPGAVEDADIDGPEAWDIHTGELGTVTIAIIDSGVGLNVLYAHIEFSGRMVPGINTIDPGNPDLTIDECTSHVNGHGTHVTGIAAAKGNNGVGVAGVTWGVNIMPVRVLGGYHGCWGEESHCAAGIIWATDNGADIGNISLQFDGTQTLEDAVDYAYGQGVLLVAAAGNHGITQPTAVRAPARYDNCMAVSATTDCDLLASFSNYGDELDACAPGDCVLSTTLGDTYGNGSGTSMAAPHVSGLAALMKSYRPGIPHVAIRTLINNSADDLGDPGWDIEYGHGRVNAYNALVMAETAIWITSSSPPDGVIDARQPSEPNGDDPDGWDRFTLTFSGDVSELTGDDFTVESEGSGTTPGIDDVLPAGDEMVTVILDSSIPVLAWTTIRHDFSGTSARIGYLPTDVNGDGTSSPADILALVDALNGVIDLEIWQTDIDRDGEPEPADILRMIWLLDGEGVYDVYLGATLP